MKRENREEIIPRNQNDRINYYILCELMEINDKLEKLIPKEEVIEVKEEKPKRRRTKKEVIE